MHAPILCSPALLRKICQDILVELRCTLEGYQLIGIKQGLAPSMGTGKQASVFGGHHWITFSMNERARNLDLRYIVGHRHLRLGDERL